MSPLKRACSCRSHLARAREPESSPSGLDADLVTATSKERSRRRSVAARSFTELPLRAAGAVEGELRRLVAGEPCVTALLIGRQPGDLALDAVGYSGDALCAQQPSPVVMAALMMISRTLPVCRPAALEYNAAPTVA
jgi:hypothetical protein